MISERKMGRAVKIAPGFEAWPWVLAAAISGVVGMKLSAFLPTDWFPDQVLPTIFLVSAFTALLFIPYVAFRGPKVLAMRRWRVHLVRAVLNLAGCLFLSHAVPYMAFLAWPSTARPSAGLLSILSGFILTTPLAGALLARLVLDEKLDWRQWLCAVTAFLGAAMLFLRLSFSSAPAIFAFLEYARVFPAAYISGVVAALCFAASHVVTKRYGREETTPALIFWLAFFGAVISAPFAFSGGFNKQILLASALITPTVLMGQVFWITGLKRGGVFAASQTGCLALPIIILGAVIVEGAWNFVSPEALQGCALIILAVFAAAIPLKAASWRDRLIVWLPIAGSGWWLLVDGDPDRLTVIAAFLISLAALVYEFFREPSGCRDFGAANDKEGAR